MERKKRDAKKLSLADLGEPELANVEVAQEEPASKPKGEPIVSKDAMAILSTELDDMESAEIFSSEALLSDKERKFYLKRRRQYLEEFQINQSSDLGVIHRILMEEIICERLYSSMLENPANDYSEAINDSHKRYEIALKQMGASRDQRIKNRETGGISVADAAKRYLDERKPASTDMEIKRSAEDELLSSQQDHRFQLEYGRAKDAGEIDKEPETTDEDSE